MLLNVFNISVAINLSKKENVSVTRITLSLTCEKLGGQDFGDPWALLY